MNEEWSDKLHGAPGKGVAIGFLDAIAHGLVALRRQEGPGFWFDPPALREVCLARYWTRGFSRARTVGNRDGLGPRPMTGDTIRVLHAIPSIAPVQGGPSAAIRMMERALSDQGVMVETTTTDDDGPGVRLCRPLGVRLEEEGAKRWYFRKSSELFKLSWSFLPWMLRSVSRYDLVHVHALFSFTSVAAAWSARRARVPYVIRPLGVLARYGVTRRRPLFKRLSLRFVEGPLLRDAAAVHFTSEAERDEALALGIPMRSVVIPLGVEPVPAGNAGRFLEREPERADPIRLVYLSRLHPKKNLEGLLRALGLLRREGMQPGLLIGGAGDGAYVGQLHALAREEGVADQLRWLGHVSGDSKADLLEAADLFVLPSFSENFGIAVVEALAAGLPCVLGRGVALAGKVESAEAGVAVDPEPASIAMGLRQYLESAERRRTAGDAARRLARSEYSVERMGEQLVALYRSILETPLISRKQSTRRMR
jgi:glycosyltransferase involved in cell wall biosynthesis